MADGIRRPVQVEVSEQRIENEHGQGERDGEFGEALHASSVPLMFDPLPPILMTGGRPAHDRRPASARMIIGLALRGAGSDGRRCLPAGTICPDASRQISYRGEYVFPTGPFGGSRWPSAEVNRDKDHLPPLSLRSDNTLGFREWAARQQFEPKHLPPAKLDAARISNRNAKYDLGKPVIGEGHQPPAETVDIAAVGSYAHGQISPPQHGFEQTLEVLRRPLPVRPGGIDQTAFGLLIQMRKRSINPLVLWMQDDPKLRDTLLKPGQGFARLVSAAIINANDLPLDTGRGEFLEDADMLGNDGLDYRFFVVGR